MQPVLAVDIGGTKLDIGLVTSDGEVQARVRQPTQTEATGDELFDQVRRMVDEVTAGSAPDGIVGVGCGGPMREKGRLVSPLNIPAWRDFPLAERLTAHVDRPVVVDNDAKALTLAEGWLGAARGCSDYLGMVVSTGIGGGIVSNGELLDGADGNAGHIGHLVVVPEGREHAGIAGALEGEASGTAIAAHTGAPAAEADAAWRERTGRLVGRAVGGVANLLDLRLAVVAGSVAFGYGDDFFTAAQDECDRVARLDYSAGTRIVPAGLGPDAPLIGAAALALHASGHQLLGRA